MWPNTYDLLAMIGALSPEKRVDVAVDALAELPGTRLVIAGGGPRRDALAGLAARRAPGRVTFLGSTDRPATVLAAADALVFLADRDWLGAAAHARLNPRLKTHCGQPPACPWLRRAQVWSNANRVDESASRGRGRCRGR